MSAARRSITAASPATARMRRPARKATTRKSGTRQAAVPRSGSRAMRRASSADRRPGQGHVAQAEGLLPVLGEDLGHEHRRRELDELGGLELEAADQDPAARPRDDGREAQDVEKRHHGEGVEEHGPVGEAPVVEAGGHHEPERSHPDQGELLQVEVGVAARVGGGVHHRHPDEGEREGRPEEDPVHVVDEAAVDPPGHA